MNLINLDKMTNRTDHDYDNLNTTIQLRNCYEAQTKREDFSRKK